MLLDQKFSFSIQETEFILTPTGCKNKTVERQAQFNRVKMQVFNHA